MKDFYIDFSEYPEEVAKVLYEEVQKHAFELGCIWQNTGVRIEKYQSFWVSMIFRPSVMSKWCVPCPELDKVSVEDFLAMKKVPKYHVGMPLGQSHGGNVILYLNSDGERPDCFTGIALKHDYNEYQYITNGYYIPCCWEPIDTSRIKVTIK